MAASLRWLADQNVSPPIAVSLADASRKQPVRKEKPAAPATGAGSAIAPHMAGLRTDLELEQFLKPGQGRPAVVEFGSTWCAKCHEIFPTFYALSKKYDEFRYAVAQVDYMKEGAKGLKYSPTFLFYSPEGQVVDSVLGSNPQRLEDHLWMHSNAVPPDSGER